MISRHGLLAVGDVNGDGLDDVSSAGSGVPGRLFIQQRTAVSSNPLRVNRGKPTKRTRIGALFFDANGDGLPTVRDERRLSPAGLSVVAGSPLYQPGRGRFVRDARPCRRC
jgi:hypothetical protein